MQRIRSGLSSVFGHPIIRTIFGLVIRGIDEIANYGIAIVWAVFVATLVNLVFSAATMVFWNLFVAPSSSWQQASFTFLYGLYMVGWIVALWVKNYATSKKEK